MSERAKASSQNLEKGKDDPVGARVFQLVFMFQCRLELIFNFGAIFGVFVWLEGDGARVVFAFGSYLNHFAIVDDDLEVDVVVFDVGVRHDLTLKSQHFGYSDMFVSDQAQKVCSIFVEHAWVQIFYRLDSLVVIVDIMRTLSTHFSQSSSLVVHNIC